MFTEPDALRGDRLSIGLIGDRAEHLINLVDVLIRPCAAFFGPCAQLIDRVVISVGSFLPDRPIRSLGLPDFLRVRVDQPGFFFRHLHQLIIDDHPTLLQKSRKLWVFVPQRVDPDHCRVVERLIRLLPQSIVVPAVIKIPQRPEIEFAVAFFVIVGTGRSEPVRVEGQFLDPPIIGGGLQIQLLIDSLMPRAVDLARRHDQVLQFLHVVADVCPLRLLRLGQRFLCVIVIRRVVHHLQAVLRREHGARRLVHILR